MTDVKQWCRILCRAARARLGRCLTRDGARGRLALLCALTCFLLTLPPQPPDYARSSDTVSAPTFGEIHYYPGYDGALPAGDGAEERHRFQNPDIDKPALFWYNIGRE